MQKHLTMALSSAALFTTTAVFAQAPQVPANNLERLGAFKTTGASPNIPHDSADRPEGRCDQEKSPGD